MSLICDRGHRARAVEGDRCPVKLGSKGAVCRNRLYEEPQVERCWRCDRGIYAEGHCSFCGHVDPRTRPEAQGDQNPANVTAFAQVTAAQTPAQRAAKYRNRARQRAALRIQEMMGNHRE